MYINNAAADPSKLSNGNYNAEEEFGKKQAVFYQNGNWEYENGNTSDKLGGKLISLSDLTFDNAYKPYFKDAENKPVEAYEHDMKLWWPHNEGIVASLLLFKIFDILHNFFFIFFITTTARDFCIRIVNLTHDNWKPTRRM